jgi:hypothetical protein
VGGALNGPAGQSGRILRPERGGKEGIKARDGSPGDFAAEESVRMGQKRPLRRMRRRDKAEDNGYFVRRFGRVFLE